MLKSNVAHGLTVSLSNRDKLTMRNKPLKTHDLILSLSKDEAKISCFSACSLSQPHPLADTVTSSCELAKASSPGRGLG